MLSVAAALGIATGAIPDKRERRNAHGGSCVARSSGSSVNSTSSADKGRFGPTELSSRSVLAGDR
jgi:hypothetical protein